MVRLEGPAEAAQEVARMPQAETGDLAPSEKTQSSVLYAFVAVLALIQGGCLLAVAGVAGGAAATGYFYCKGQVYRDFPANFIEVHNAVRAALLDLHFIIFTEEAKDGKAFFVTKTTNGKKVRIYLNCLSSPIPAEGLLTRVSIRVACFGDEAVSAHIFDQVAYRLSHSGPIVAPPPGPPPVAPPQPIQPTGFQTSEPKLAPAK
jgi:uncharacterized protein DUF3568